MPEDIKQVVSVDDQASAKLDQISAAEQAWMKKIEAQAQAAELNNQKQQRRQNRLQQIDEELKKLARQEQRYQNAVARGVHQSDQAIAQSAVRTVRMDQLGRAIAKRRMAEDMASASIKKHIQVDQDAERGLQKMLGTLGLTSDGFKTLALSAVGGGGLVGAFTALIKVVGAYNAEMEKSVQLSDEIKNAQLDLQFLSQGFRPDEIAMVRKASEKVGGENAQAITSQAFAELKSQTAGMGELDRIKLFEQMVETSLTTSSPLTALTRLFVEVNKRTGDAERTQALIRKAQELSPAASPEVLAQALPQVLEPGQQVGMTVEETVGLLITALNTDRERGTTSARNIMTLLQAPQTPDQQAILNRLGATPDKGLLSQLDILSQAGLPIGDIKKLVGQENVVTFSGMLKNRQQTIDQTNQLLQATTGKTDLTKEAIQNIYSHDRAQALRLMKKQSAAQEANAKQNQSSGFNEWEAAIQFVQARIAEHQATQGTDPAVGMTLAKAAKASMKIQQWIPFSDIRSTIARELNTAFLTKSEIDNALNQWDAGPDLNVSDISQAYENAQQSSQTNPSMQVNPQWHESTTSHIDQSMHVHIATQVNYATDPHRDIRKPMDRED